MSTSALLIALTFTVPPAEDPVRSILRAIEGTDTALVAAAEEAFNELPDKGTARVLGTYAAALMRISQRRYADAEKLIADLSDDARTSPPFMRIQFWLAWQKGDAERTWGLAERLMEQVERGPAENLETQQTVDWLAELIAATEVAEEHAVITTAQGAELKQRLAGLASPTLKNHVKQHYQRALRRCAELQKHLIDADKTGADTVTAELETMRKAFNVDSQAFTAEISQHEAMEEEIRKRMQQNFKERQMIAAYEKQLYKWWNEPTAGHPGRPPSPPSGQSKGEDDSDSEYRKKEEEYERKLKTYDSKLDKWQSEDRARRNKLQSEKIAAEVKKKASLETKKQLDLEHEQRETDFQKRRLEYESRKTNLSTLEFVQRALTDSRKSLFTPEPLGILSMSAERGRISAVLLKASKPLIEDSEPDLLLEK